jgi:hypothetical protein
MKGAAIDAAIITLYNQVDSYAAEDTGGNLIYPWLFDSILLSDPAINGSLLPMFFLSCCTKI